MSSVVRYVPSRYLYYTGTIGAMWLAGKICSKSGNYFNMNKSMLETYLARMGICTKIVFNFVKLIESGMLTKEIINLFCQKYYSLGLHYFIPYSIALLFGQIAALGLFIESSGQLYNGFLRLKSTSDHN
jgi:hypothetical protein